MQKPFLYDKIKLDDCIKYWEPEESWGGSANSSGVMSYKNNSIGSGYT